MGMFSNSVARGGARAGKAAARHLARAGHAPPLATTTNDGPVYCRVCGNRVRSKLGEVCTKPRCHSVYLSRQR